MLSIKQLNYLINEQKTYKQLTIFFFFNDTATTEIYTLSLHDALPISENHTEHGEEDQIVDIVLLPGRAGLKKNDVDRSEEHTSELQSQSNLVCRLLLEKKKRNENAINPKSYR